MRGKRKKPGCYDEVGIIRKPRKNRIRVALVYPNTYFVGMSNLGFQIAYLMFNQTEHISCERAFLPDQNISGPIRTVETGSLLSDADIIAFSISYENDYLNILDILARAGIPLRSENRESPLVMAGGIACYLNPEPIARFIDVFLIGEAEVLIPCLAEFLEEWPLLRRSGGIFGTEKRRFLKEMVRNIPGAYAPQFYRPSYHKDGTLQSFDPEEDVPAKIPRRFLEDIWAAPSCSVLLTPHTEFSNTYLIEVGRGCPRGCRFCSAGYITRPPRFRPVSLLKDCVRKGAEMTDKIAFMGPSVSDLPGLTELCGQAVEDNLRVSFSSLRADALSPEIVSALKQSRVRTATIAPDAGSDRMRRVINKGMREEDILKAVYMLVSGGIPNLKLYFMVGLPAESDEDAEAIIRLCRNIKSEFLKSSRPRGRIGEITVSLNAFVPKPFTPFQRARFRDIRTLKKKITRIQNGLKSVANLRVRAESPARSRIQAILSRGDRKVADILEQVSVNKGNWTRTLKEIPTDNDLYRERGSCELLPWAFIDHRISRDFLEKEYARSKQGIPSLPCPMKVCSRCGVCMA